MSLQRKPQWVSSACSSHCGHIHTAFLREEPGRSHWDKPQGCLTLLTSWLSTVWKFILSCPSRWKLPEHHSPCFVTAPYPSYLGCPSVKGEPGAERMELVLPCRGSSAAVLRESLCLRLLLNLKLHSSSNLEACQRDAAS